MRRIIGLIAGIIVSGVSLYFVLRGVPLQEVWASIQQATITWIGASLGFTVLGLWTRGIRWRGLLPKPIPMRDAFLMMGITFTLNQLPLRAGEIARAVLATRYEVPLVTAATSVVLERLLDVLIVVLMLSAAITQLPEASPQVVQAATLFGVLGVVGFVVLVIFAHFPKRAHQLLDVVYRLLPFLERLPLRALLDDLLSGLQPLTQWHTLGHMMLWTAISWLISLLSLYTLLLALGIRDVDTLLMTVLGLTLAAFSLAIPINFLSLGLLEGAIALAGELVGMDAVAYTALGFLFHGVAVLGYALVGLPGIVLLGFSLGDIRATQAAPTQIVEKE